MARSSTAAPGESRALQSKAPRRPWRGWLTLAAQPILMLLGLCLFFILLATVQRLGWLTADSKAAGGSGDSSTERYICPMMCTPPQAEPGRCPVCAMELVAASGTESNSEHVELTPASRRLAHIETAPVRSAPIVREIRAVGQLAYNESGMKALAAYVAGRLEQLHADVTGMEVQRGDRLAVLYSPQLYSSQVEFLLARKQVERQAASSLPGMLETHQSLLENARRRLLELGMTDEQIQALETTGEAISRLPVVAPISGTVIEKHVVEGQYVNEGQTLLQLADLDTVWLVLELLPEEAAWIRYGQPVTATVQAHPGETFPGRVAFVEPEVDPRSRTVAVRVVLQNPKRRLRVRDFARATLQIPIIQSNEGEPALYEPELAGQWICPVHPHEVSSTADVCPSLGTPFLATSQLGYAASAEALRSALMIPRSAVLRAGADSVVYVEVEPGRFELRQVELGPAWDEHQMIQKGLEEGEWVAVRGNFLIDSQMQLVGNPSLIDVSRYAGASQPSQAWLKELSADDQALALRQAICPVTQMDLGSMGTPPKVEVRGQFIFLCCQGCETRLREDPDHYLDVLAGHNSPDVSSEIDQALAGLDPADARLARRQSICPVADLPLGSMGTPVKVDLPDGPIFLCCEGCRKSLLADVESFRQKLNVSGSTPRTATRVPQMSPPIAAPSIAPRGGEDAPRKLPPIAPIRSTTVEVIQQR